MKKSEALRALGLSEGATPEDIKKAHRKLAIENHPDKFGQDAEARAAAEERMKTINEARDVLESGKWDPEFGTGAGAAGPYAYDPFAGYRGAGTSADGQNPFQDFPFGGTTFVWTSYDEHGNAHTYRSDGGTGTNTTQENPFAGTNPFAGMGGNPFAGMGGNPFAGTPFESMFNTTTPEELLAEEKDTLKKEAIAIGLKVLMTAGCFVAGMPAVALYLYVIGSLAWSLYSSKSILAGAFIVPLVLLILIFAPAADAAVGVLGILAFVLALAWDVKDVRKRLARIKELAERIG